jgi:hypothetical protein
MLGTVVVGAVVHCGGKVDVEHPCGPAEQGLACVPYCMDADGPPARTIVCGGACPTGMFPAAECGNPPVDCAGNANWIRCVATCGGPVVARGCDGMCPSGTRPEADCKPVEPPRPPGSEPCPWFGARDGERCGTNGATCVQPPLRCADGSYTPSASCTCVGGTFLCPPEPDDCCPAPYLVRTDSQDGNRCVWSCGAGTQPDVSTLECQCEPGKVETGKDAFGRRVCQ